MKLPRPVSKTLTLLAVLAITLWIETMFWDAIVLQATLDAGPPGRTIAAD